MKKISTLFLFLLLAVTACEKEIQPANMLRIRNMTNIVASNCIVGSVVFPDVAPGETSPYLPVGKGEITLDGNLKGTLTLPETVKEDRWFTLTINNDEEKSLTIEEEVLAVGKPGLRSHTAGSFIPDNI